jgi:hypothetical protein
VVEIVRNARGDYVHSFHAVPEGQGYVRLTVAACNEWTPLVRADRASEVAQTVGNLDTVKMEAEHASHSAAGELPRWAARMRGLVETGAFRTDDSDTRWMLSSFGMEEFSD